MSGWADAPKGEPLEERDEDLFDEFILAYPVEELRQFLSLLLLLR